MATRQEVDDFLGRFKWAMEFHGLTPVGRNDFIQGLLALNLTGLAEVKKIVKSLTADNYASGPAPDATEPGYDVWIFGVVVEEIEAYVKLRLSTDPKRKRPIAGIWSCHPADRPLSYPLKGERR
jgi:hypothetical protein